MDGKLSSSPHLLCLLDTETQAPLWDSKKRSREHSGDGGSMVGMGSKERSEKAGWGDGVEHARQIPQIRSNKTGAKAHVSYFIS